MTSTLARPVAPPSPGVARVHRTRWRLVPQPGVPDEPSPRLRGARLVVFGGTLRLAARVRDALCAAGALAVTAESSTGPWTVAGEPPDGLVDLTLPASSGADYQDALLRTVSAIRACYDRWCADTSAARICYVAVTYLGGGMGYADTDDHAQPLGGIWAGLAKTLHREIPNCNTRVVDVGQSDVDKLPDILVRELYRWGLFEIGYRHGRRTSLAPVREPVAPPTVSLGADDLVLVSGGGRGIGWRAALGLATTFGCRIVVTGRASPPTGGEPWYGLDDADFRAYQRELWFGGRPPAETRAMIADVGAARELAVNLRDAVSRGLRISYRRCDVTDPGQVSRLVDELGDGLRAVVHDAGVDTPTRLPKKSDVDFVRTVRTKVDGFRSLFELVRDRPLKFFCNVGSLTGRLGAMVGQFDYGAANDGLARLGLWAGRHASFPVMTLCWPTWDRVGMVANFAATLRYMSAMDTEEGVAHWLAELRAGSRGEVTFIGPLGDALTPLQARGYPATPAIPGFTELLPRLAHLGEVRTNEPGRAQTATLSLDSGVAPALGDVTVDGDVAMPVSLLLENAIRAGEWLAPAGTPGLAPDAAAPSWPTAVTDVWVRPALLRLSGTSIRLDRTMTATDRDGARTVDVRYTAPQGDVARLRLHYGELPAASTRHPARGRRAGVRHAGMRWRGLVLPVAQWLVDGDGRHRAVVASAPPSDVWALPHVPPSRLPLSAIENVIARSAEPGGAEVLTVGRLVPHATSAGERFSVVGTPADGVWRVCDATSGEPLLDLTELHWSEQEKV
jgi:NAD(P)-dependent dehydrogenase (short-subunit alcohol dehydrogenase family)